MSLRYPSMFACLQIQFVATSLVQFNPTGMAACYAQSHITKCTMLTIVNNKALTSGWTDTCCAARLIADPYCCKVQPLGEVEHALN